MLATAAPAVFFAAGVIGNKGHQQIGYRLFEKP
jgi:hypothetical protein